MAYEMPQGAPFRRGKFLWELAMNVASDPATPQTGDRELSIAVGSSSGDRFNPLFRMATGSPYLAHAIMRGELEMAVVNPSPLLTQAYRGVGIFREPLPLRVIAVYPSWDRFAFVLDQRLGVRSLKDVRDRKLPLRISLREDPAHASRIFINQALAYYGFGLDDIVSWGGKLVTCTRPADVRRMVPLREGGLDAVWDEGMQGWFPTSLKQGFRPLDMEKDHFEYVATLGWRRASIPVGLWDMTYEHWCIDFSGWPLYCHENLSDDIAYRVAASVDMRKNAISWEEDYTGPEQLFMDTEATPFDVPLHPGAQKFLDELRAR